MVVVACMGVYSHARLRCLHFFRFAAFVFNDFQYAERECRARVGGRAVSWQESEEGCAVISSPGLSPTNTQNFQSPTPRRSLKCYVSTSVQLRILDLLQPILPTVRPAVANVSDRLALFPWLLSPAHRPGLAMMETTRRTRSRNRCRGSCTTGLVSTSSPVRRCNVCRGHT